MKIAIIREYKFIPIYFSIKRALFQWLIGITSFFVVMHKTMSMPLYNITQEFYICIPHRTPGHNEENQKLGGSIMEGEKETRLYGSDLACERRRADTSIRGVDEEWFDSPIGTLMRIRVTSEEGAKSIGRPRGRYDTLTLPRMDTLDADGIEDAREAVARELCELMYERDVSPERLLIVGLGNPRLTPDSVGSLAADLVEPTLHIRRYDERMFAALDCSEIAVIKTGVLATSGIDASEVVRGITKSIRPDAIIVIDALAARSPKRLGTTLQFSDTGIHPGSGVGAHRHSIDEEVMGVPVIAIGVPTVIDARLVVGNGEEESAEGMLVCPKDIDSIVKNASLIIGGGINQAFGVFM